MIQGVYQCPKCFFIMKKRLNKCPKCNTIIEEAIEDLIYEAGLRREKINKKIVEEALEHSDIINQDGILLDESLNLCLHESGEVRRIPEKERKYFKIYNEEVGEFEK